MYIPYFINKLLVRIVLYCIITFTERQPGKFTERRIVIVEIHKYHEYNRLRCMHWDLQKKLFSDYQDKAEYFWLSSYIIYIYIYIVYMFYFIVYIII